MSIEMKRAYVLLVVMSGVFACQESQTPAVISSPDASGSEPSDASCEADAVTWSPDGSTCIPEAGPSRGSLDMTKLGPACSGAKPCAEGNGKCYDFRVESNPGPHCAVTACDALSCPPGSWCQILESGGFVHQVYCAR